MNLARTALLTTTLLFSTSLMARPEVGLPAPDFRVVDTAGNEHSLADFAGSTLVRRNHWRSDPAESVVRRPWPVWRFQWSCASSGSIRRSGAASC